jgi:hypothetical protein
MARVVAYDLDGESTVFDLKKARKFHLVRKGFSDTHHRDPSVPRTGFLFDQVVKTADRLPRWFLSGNVTPARWSGRTVSKPRRNGRDYLEVRPKCAAEYFLKHNRRLPSELAGFGAVRGCD